MDRYEGFREFLRARQMALMRTSYLLCGDAHQAEEMLQSVLVRVAGNWRGIAADNPEAYVRRALVNEHISWWRRQRRALAFTGPPRTGRDPGDESVSRIVLWQALARLTPRQRAVLVLRFYEDRSVQEAADLLGCSRARPSRPPAGGNCRSRGCHRRPTPTTTGAAGRSPPGRPV